jgi:hypothetical protein
VPWRTRVGENTPSGVINDWHSWLSAASGICQYPWLKSNVAKYDEWHRRASSDSMLGIGQEQGTVCLLTGRKSTVNRNCAGPGFGTRSGGRTPCSAWVPVDHTRGLQLRDKTCQKIPLFLAVATQAYPDRRRIRLEIDHQRWESCGRAGGERDAPNVSKVI